MMFKIVTVLALVGAASAACPNQCSGHGSCGNQDVCECYDNWGMGGAEGGDCSDRVCPFELAWVDAPNADGEVHQYAECAAKGICDRSTGQCDCLDGYEGKACARQVCKDGCNGHGTCAYMNQIPFGTVFGDWAFNNPNAAGKAQLGTVGAVRSTTTAEAWDAERSRACVCDSEWSGISCASRMCPHGNDAMFVTEYTVDEDYQSQVQTIKLTGSESFGATDTFALTFTSRTNQTFTTVPIALSASDSDADALLLAARVKDALMGLPNRVIDDVVVTAIVAAQSITITVTFSGDGVQGRQNLLELDINPCGAGCTPRVSGLVAKLVAADSGIWEEEPADFNTYECGRRGKCDHDTGICACFVGFTGAACTTVTALI